MKKNAPPPIELSLRQADVSDDTKIYSAVALLGLLMGASKHSDEALKLIPSQALTLGTAMAELLNKGAA